MKNGDLILENISARNYSYSPFHSWNSGYQVLLFISNILLNFLLTLDIENHKIVCVRIIFNAGWSSLVARRAHNPKVGGSNPSPATTKNFTYFNKLQEFHKVFKPLKDPFFRFIVTFYQKQPELSRKSYVSDLYLP